MTTINDELRAEAISARRARRAAWQNAHVDRLVREREARESARQYRRAQRETTGPAPSTKHCSKCRQSLPLSAFGRQSWCKACAATYAREKYHRMKGGLSSSATRAASPERQREYAERVVYLTSLLMGTNPGEQITSEQGWDAVTSELHSLWLQSGDKECASCKAVVPPSAMLPPGPANFYPGKCRSCTADEYRAHSLRVFGKACGPRLIPMRDGSSITIAEFARRCRERGRG